MPRSIENRNRETEPLLERNGVNNPAEADIDDYPEGGRGWLVILGTFLALNMSFGMVTSFGVYQMYYEKKFSELRPRSIALIGSLQPFMIYLSSIPTVTLINVCGVKYTVVIGYCIMIFALAMVPYCDSLSSLYIFQGVLFGFGAGIMYFISMSIPSEWFKRKRATAIGITSSGASLGGVIWPAVLQKTAANIGFTKANAVVAGLYVPFMICSALLIKTRFPSKKNSILPKLSVMKDKKFVAIIVANGIGMFGHFAPLFYVSSFAHRLPNISPSVASSVLVIMNAFSGIGRTIPTILADKLGRLNMLFFCVFLTGFSQYAFWYPAQTDFELICFAITWGIGSGAFTALYPPTMGQLFGIEDNQSRLGFFFLLSTFGSILGPVIFGSFLPDDGKGVEGYGHGALFSGGAMLTASFILLAVRLSYSTKLKVFI